jgi:translocation and assembly module TamB
VRLAGTARPTGESDLRLTVEGLDLADLEDTLARAEERRAAGTLGAEAVLTGTLAAPRLVVAARIDDLRIGAVPYAGATLRVVATPARAEVDAALTQAAGRAVRLDAALPVDFALSPFRMAVTGPIAGTLVADAIDLAFVDTLTPALADVGGTFAADLAIGGTPEKLALRGPLTIAGGRARVPAVGLTYTDLDVAVRLDGQAAAVERLRVVSGEGTLAGSGRVRVGAEGPELDVRIELTRFPLFGNAYGRGAASGWLWASGTLAAPVIEGSLATDALVLQVPETLPGRVRPPDPTIEVIGPDAPPPTVRPASADAASAAPAPDVFANAALTIQLQVPRNAWIRRSDAEIELRGWITAWKKPHEDLQLSGDINVVRGWFSFQGKNFDATEGEVTFTGAGLNPNLRLVASHRAGEYTARVVIGGTLAKPTLTLESDPPLPQADILSVIVFGKPASELSSGESVGLREQALGIAAGYAASELRQSVARALGVDTLEFSGGSSLEEAEISAGKYVARDVFVSLSHKFGEAVEELRIQYFLTPRWTIETSTDTLGRSALDVFWKLRY